MTGMSLFKTNDYSKPEPVKIVYGGRKKLSKPKTQNTRNLFLLKKKKKEIKGRIIRDIWTLFETKEEEKEIKKAEKKEENNRLIKHGIIRYIRTHFA